MSDKLKSIETSICPKCSNPKPEYEDCENCKIVTCDFCKGAGIISSSTVNGKLVDLYCKLCEGKGFLPILTFNFKIESNGKESYDPRDEKDALSKQVGGHHYKDLSIQPMEYSERNDLGALAHSIIKYATRAGRKGDKNDHKLDIEKIIHCAELWLQIHYNED